MESMRVLVTGVGGAAGVVALKSLQNQNIDTVGVNCYDLTAGFKLANDYSVVPFAKDKDYIPTLFEVCKDKAINILLPTVDEELIICAENRQLFEQAGVKVAISQEHVLKKCLDKWHFYLELQKRNLPVAMTWLADKELKIGNIQYPVIAKPRTGRGGRGISYFSCPSDLSLFLEEHSDYVIQEYLEGEEYTVDTLSDFNGKALVAVPRRRIEIKGGVCWKGSTEINENIMKTCMEVVESIGIKGAACVQLKLDAEGGIKIFEINPRIGGTTSLSVAAGVDIPFLMIKLLQNQEITQEELQFRELFISRYFEDVFFEKSELANEI